jgi:hypothetical protein
MRKIGAFLLFLIILFACSERKSSKYNQEEMNLFQKYPQVFFKYKDTDLVLNVFRYICIDTSTFKQLRIQMFAYDIMDRDHDSVLKVDYKITSIYIQNPELYRQLYSIKATGTGTKKQNTAKLYQSFFDDFPRTVNEIRELLNLTSKIPRRAAIRMWCAKMDRLTKWGMIQPNNIKRLNVFLFREGDLDQTYYYFQKNDSILFPFEAFWTLANYRDLIIENIKDTAQLFPVKLNFDTAGKFESILLNSTVPKEQLKNLKVALTQKNTALKLRLVNDKPLPYSFILITVTLAYRDEKNIVYP